MRRDVTARMTLEAMGPVRFAVAIAVARGYRADETFTARIDGRPIDPELVDDHHDAVLHCFAAGPGLVEIEYRARVDGLADPAPVSPIDALRYARPSRYAESDRLAPIARAEFAGLTGQDLVAAVTSWVGTRIAYEPGSSQPTDGATNTLLARAGVCRDFAHLVVALLRALDVPARVVSVYAPGLAPMDFHAVAEVLVDGSWQVVDATTLAPRGTLVRIATGRDAADTAFLTTHGADVRLIELEVTAVADELPDDDVRRPAALR